jgi:hypothetical protein
LVEESKEKRDERIIPQNLLSPPSSVTYFVRSTIKFTGDYSGGDTPLPIPNREVKPARADGTVPMVGTGE